MVKPNYGRGHPAFLQYVKFITEHPTYAGMPDLHTDRGGIQWVTPSNRGAGKFKDTHHKRRDWWRKKAIEAGIDMSQTDWPSRTAKQIHPTKRKPCQNCGLVLDIRYAYPSQTLIGRINKFTYVEKSFQIDPLEHITELLARLVKQYGNRVFADLPKILKTGQITPPKTIGQDLDSWLEWINGLYIPCEPSTLSPGVMSNAPDRLDGFHTFNRCCRSKADPGRSKENLQSYSTDRRVFEYWVEGDWVAADRLMGQIRSLPLIRSEDCSNGHSGPCSADHIGPISLGFVHRPEFKLLCQRCNSAKNNRMTYQDVEHLWTVEENGEEVTSWYSKALWDARKSDVVDEETALRLSKVLRDNRHTVMYILNRFVQKGHFTFLATLLGLEYARYEVSFVNLRISDHVTQCDKIQRTPRKTKYATEQMARRFRVAFEALKEYACKDNRNAFVVSSEASELCLLEALAALDNAPQTIKDLDLQIADVVNNDATVSDEDLRILSQQIPTTDQEPAAFKEAKSKLQQAMDQVSLVLSEMWTSDRYVRSVFEEDPLI